jgi:hypothetical protein
MERCPRCGAIGRSGAKFCSTCGFRFESEESALMVDEGPNPRQVEHPDGHGNAEGAGNLDSDATGPSSGWPPPPRSEEMSGVSGGWPSSSASPTYADFGVSTGSAAEWPRNAEDSWPGDSAEVTEATPSNPGSEQRDDGFWLANAENAFAAHADQGDGLQPIDQANRLIDELRAVVATLGSPPNHDFTGVISDLEVAVTPPGALGADERAELREALLRARDRPRDLETAVDLSGRVDGMVALVFAYDRAIAAIERSLTVLRREPATSVLFPASGTASAGADLPRSTEE